MCTSPCSAPLLMQSPCGTQLLSGPTLLSVASCHLPAVPALTAVAWCCLSVLSGKRHRGIGTAPKKLQLDLCPEATACNGCFSTPVGPHWDAVTLLRFTCCLSCNLRKHACMTHPAQAAITPAGVSAVSLHLYRHGCTFFRSC